ncbi:MAG TPA: hypothetical protein VLK83_08880 [Rhodanobacteraceae bacterium]|jgi:hypothetical protein|nr:hypothetical protein [Rhodanobacteraceae bacterium]
MQQAAEKQRVKEAPAPAMAYDIGMGRCAEIAGEFVVVKLDSVIVKKLTPGQPWRKSGTSLLRFDRKLCSSKRPPMVDQELYLDSAALSRKAPASLDLDGNGEMRQVDLRVILEGLNPQPAPTPKAKQAVYRSR